MNGALPLLPLHAFITLTGTSSPIYFYNYLEKLITPLHDILHYLTVPHHKPHASIFCVVMQFDFFI